MALIPCRECNCPISSDARTCPQCGAKIVKPIGAVGAIFAIFFIYAVGTFVYDAVQRGNTTDAAAATPDIPASQASGIAASIRKTAKNPDSIKWVSVGYIETPKGKAGDGAYCYEFRGANSFNATVLEHHAVIVRGNKVAPATWNSACAGKQARDLSAVVRLYE